MSKSNILKRAAPFQRTQKEHVKAEKICGDIGRVLRNVEWHDGDGNCYSARLQAMAAGPPSYCLEVFPNGPLWLEDEDIAKLARFFAWLKKHAASERMMLREEYTKAMVRLGEARFKSGWVHGVTQH
jgi:hypothetical protein